MLNNVKLNCIQFSTNQEFCQVRLLTHETLASVYIENAHCKIRVSEKFLPGRHAAGSPAASQSRTGRCTSKRTEACHPKSAITRLEQ